MSFIGRKEELNNLLTLIQSNHFNCSLILGRRRVGKTALVKETLRLSKCKYIYYECKNVSEESNIDGLVDATAHSLNIPQFHFNHIEDFLRYIIDLSKEEKIVLVLDEYPYLRTSVKGLDSIIQALIDNNKDTSKLSLILLGSFVETMQSLVYYSNPLYGRIDRIFNLKPMDYYESSLFYPNYSESDKVKLYSVFGGIPYYNSLIDTSLSVEDNIIKLIASENALLINEIPYYLNTELSKILNANEVFTALAKGYTKYSDLLSQSHVSSGPTLIDTLEKLIKMEIVKKETPINESTSKKRTSYSICDQLALFYYRYIFRNASLLEVMDSKTFYDLKIREDFETQYVPHQFETICRQYLIRLNKAGKLDPVFTNIGKYYYNNPKEKTNGEFDVVTLDQNGYIFYEAKFKNNPIDNQTIQEEIEQVKKTGIDCYKYGFISKSGFDCEKTDNLILINLNELYDSLI